MSSDPFLIDDTSHTKVAGNQKPEHVQFPPEYHRETFFQLHLLEQAIQRSRTAIEEIQRALLKNDLNCDELTQELVKNHTCRHGKIQHQLNDRPDRASTQPDPVSSLSSKLTHHCKLTSCQDMSDELNRKIQREEMVIRRCREKMGMLRHWTAPMSLTDLPHELLLLILASLDFLHQQRLVRVCKFWMRTLSSEIDHVHLDAGAPRTFDTKSGIIFRPGLGAALYSYQHRRTTLTTVFFARRADTNLAATFPWKFNRRPVRQVTFNGQYIAQFVKTVKTVLEFADNTFPALIQVNFRHCIIPTGYVAGMVADQLSQRYPRLRLSLSACVTTAFPLNLDTVNRYEDGIRQIRHNPPSELEFLYDNRNMTFHLPDLTWGGEDLFSTCYGWVLGVIGMAKPYPPSQTEWLVQWAPQLNAGMYVLRYIREQSFTWNFGEPAKPIMCMEHRKFCDHLTGSFYEEMDGQFRNLLACWLYQLKLPGMKSPDEPFPFEHSIPMYVALDI